MQNASPATAASVFFLFLLFAPVSPQCRTGTVNECSRSMEFIPGLSLVSRGFDITTLTPSTYDVMNFTVWRNPAGTCTVCENPLLAGKPLQRLPLGIIDWKVNITCQHKVHYSELPSCISVANSLTALIVRNDWKKDLVVNVDPSTYTQLALEGTDSRYVDFCQLKTQEDKYIFLLHHVSCSYYKFRTGNNSVSVEFQSNVRRLPTTLNSSSILDYTEIILKYGTHFMTELDFGARVIYLTGLEVCRLPLMNYTISDISHCMEIEVGVLIGFDKMTQDPYFEKCKQKLTDIIFLFLVSERLKDLEGGRIYYFDFSDQAFHFPQASQNWLESVKTLPALLSASLEPLHTLLDKNDPRRENLRQVLSRYVKDKAKLRKCTLPCPAGVQLSAWEPCSCECPDNDFTTSMCCSKQPGIGRLTITILHAERLWGDYFTRTDGYVSVTVQEKIKCTHTVWDNNYPEWNTRMEFEIANLTDFAKIKLEVWDEDYKWSDDFLGKCLLTLRPFETVEHVCHLNHGSLYYKGQLFCGHHLGGPSCRNYGPQWSN